MDMQTAQRDTRSRLLDVLVPMLVFGSVWGLSEVALGGGLKAAGFPYRSGLLTGIGMGIIGAAMALYRRPLMGAGIGLVAALVSLMAVPLLHVSVLCRANSCLAVFIEGSSLGLIAAAVASRTSGNVYLRMGTGAAAALAASAAFYAVGGHVAPCAYFASFGSTGSFVVKEGMIWAAFAAILFPLGYLVGEQLRVKAQRAIVQRAASYYGLAATISSLAVGGSALAILAGL